ncbi:hypothetical protein EN742_29435 [Mesorhizobium sp. M4A.F.Ca.ET.020.02.1.1]|uniref:hypothetical protein n=1 Tax=unclassified Mesorhizobium TaxID=325217 RepID=UPI000FCC8744|nr:MULTISPECIES: hypothetical protein [unclassified Mesorhizobium]RUX52964.1 hypothetical protein EOA33_00825 [Mesorhizobium sp. M4A.F.Ca.ET.050.02.1.1]RVC83267.1 hypothetical protein EN745_03600 [Mesorhizobium sp. M4A.F.Ca.ET.022.05.2.1]RVD33602.1 hypothetical protein EN742_29435 [Mesorhizobium sp. M4A.F.Ca.ET.020.02.1.1]RWC21086.1 MAG: hypothetical protein EOS53_07010 [Mesorhizobium sp.]RWD19479.1 MAG: hypothetical protein EOS33_30900 [Mesorhizobium sp.]
MSTIALTDPDLLFPSEANARSLGRAPYAGVEKLPSARTALPIGSRMCCAFLARLVAEHRLCEVEAHELAGELAYALAKKAYRVGRDHEGTAPSMTDRCWTS